jgi:hypothetical protein
MWMRARLKKDRKKPGMRGRNGRETNERRIEEEVEKNREEVITYCYCIANPTHKAVGTKNR